MTALLLMAVATGYAVTIGGMASILQWLYNLPMDHDPEWLIDNNLSRYCVQKPWDAPSLTCPPCKQHRKVWTIAILWPVALPLVLLYRSIYNIVGTLIGITKFFGPKKKELDAWKSF